MIRDKRYGNTEKTGELKAKAKKWSEETYRKRDLLQLQMRKRGKEDQLQAIYIT